MAAFKPKVILDRAEVATPESPLAVFRLPPEAREERALGMLECVFGDTVESRRRLASNDPDFVISLDGSQDREAMMTLLQGAAEYVPAKPKRGRPRSRA